MRLLLTPLACLAVLGSSLAAAAQKTSTPAAAPQAVAPCFSNLVRNGNFEAVKVNPMSGYERNVYTPTPQPNHVCYDELESWQATNSGSATFYNTASSGGTNPGSSVYGAFTPFSGNGAIGLVGTWLYQYDRPANLNFAEYVTQPLIRPLDSNYSYYASMRVLSPTGSAYGTTIGMYVTTNDPKDYSYTPFRSTSTGNFDYPVTYTAAPAASGCGIQSAGIVSSSQWQRVSGIFQGVSNAQYLNVGNFQPTVNQSLRTIAPPYNFMSATYIDDVELYRIPTAGQPVTTSCTAPVIIGEGCNIPGASYAWTIGNAAPFSSSYQTQVNPAYTTTYTLTVTLPDGEQFSSSVTVTVNVTAASAGPNQVICPGQSAVIGQGCPPAGTTFAWRIEEQFRTFSTSLQTTVTPSTTTTYVLTVRSPSGTYSSSSVTVTVFDPSVNFMPTYTRTAADECNRAYTYQITNYNSAYSYSIQSSFGLVVVSGISSTGSFTLQASGSKYRSGDFSVTADYAGCGGNTATSPTTTITYGGCDARPAALTTAYPNPATETLRLPEGAEQGVLLNNQGRAVQQADKLGQLEVRSLPAGLYILRMVQQGKVVKQQIEVKH